MNKNVLVISTSLRPQSNSEALADEFVRGAVAAGHNVEKISLRGKEIHFCRGCLACQHTGRCVQVWRGVPETLGYHSSPDLPAQGRGTLAEL